MQNFHYLNAKDKAYIKEKGWDKIEQGTRETIAKRLAPAFIPNDGKQTPMRHGIFLSEGDACGSDDAFTVHFVCRDVVSMRLIHYSNKGNFSRNPYKSSFAIIL